MDIEVGEWVRSKFGEIKRVDRIFYNKKTSGIEEYGQIIKKEAYTVIDAHEVVKHSKNILDLIEVGDIVECFVEEDVDGEDTIKYEVAATGVTDIEGNSTNEIGICGEDGVELIPFKNIRSILTHEQYERNAYRLEE